MEPALKSAPAADFSNRSREAAPGPKKKDATGIQRQEAESLAPAPAGRAAADSAGKYLPRISLQLVVADRAAASESIRTAASRSGALIVEDVHPADNRIRIRIAADRLPELMERLGRIGRLTDRPRQPSPAEEFEVTILW
jgi:hypothetical protein